MAILTPYQSQAGIATANAGSGGQQRSLSAFVTPGAQANTEGWQELQRGFDKLSKAGVDLYVQRQQQQDLLGPAGGQNAP